MIEGWNQYVQKRNSFCTLFDRAIRIIFSVNSMNAEALGSPLETSNHIKLRAVNLTFSAACRIFQSHFQLFRIQLKFIWRTREKIDSIIEMSQLILNYYWELFTFNMFIYSQHILNRPYILWIRLWGEMWSKMIQREIIKINLINHSIKGFYNNFLT